MAAGVEERGAESPEGGEERKDDEMVEEEEGEELLGDVALPARLGDVSRPLRPSTEDLGQEEVEQAGDCRWKDALDDAPGRGTGE